MPNAVKYSTTKVNNSIKKRNVILGVNNVDYSPTSTTGYWNGITPPLSGYTIYTVPSASTTPSIVCPVTDADVIYWAKAFGGGSNITTKGLALQYITSALTNTIVVNKNYPDIVTSGVAINLDAGFVPSYPVSGSTTYDVSGNEATGTLSTVTFINDKAFSLNGSNSNIICSSSAAIDNLSASTFSILYNWTEDVSVTSTSLLYKSDSNGSAGWFINIDNNNGGIGIQVCRSTANATYYLPSARTPARNRWTDLTITWTGLLTTFGTQVKIYINGVEDTTTPQTLDTGSGNHTTDAAEPLNIGNSRNGSAWYFGGYVGGVKIYNRVLNSTEILQNYYQSPITTSGLTLMMDASNLVSYFTGSTWYDMTANGYSANMSGGTVSYVNVPPQYFDYGGNPYYFVGTNSLASKISTQITIISWIKITNIANRSVIFDKYQATTPNGYVLEVGTSSPLWINTVRFYAQGSNAFSTDYRGVASALTQNVIYMVSATFNSDTKITKMYVNQSEISATQAGNITSIDSTWSQGTNLYSLGSFRPDISLDSSMNQYSLMVYNRELSAAEISNMYYSMYNKFT